jgi:hypothetical protein
MNFLLQQIIFARNQKLLADNIPPSKRIGCHTLRMSLTEP